MNNVAVLKLGGIKKIGKSVTAIKQIVDLRADER